MQAPVAYTVVKSWVDSTRRVAPTEADGMVTAHVRTVCSPRTFGAWAHAFSKLPAHEVEPFISHAIRTAYLQATWTQSVVGIIEALGFEKEPRLPSGIWSAGVMSPPVMAAIADAVLSASPDRNVVGRWRRALVLITRTDLASVIDERQKLLPRVNRRARELNAAPSPEVFPASAPKPKASPALAQPAPVKQTQPKKRKKKPPQSASPPLKPVAAVVVRSRECPDVEAYLAESGKRNLTVETVFLATALTYRPQWRLLFEQPVSVKISSRRRSLSAVTATMGRDSIALRFATTGGRPVAPTFVNVDFRQRTYATGNASHVALVLLDLLFAHEGRLTASQAVGDEKFAADRLAPDGQGPAAVYRLSDRPRWVDGGCSGQLVTHGAAGSRRPHDVRGYRQTRDGKTYWVGPYHRSS